MKYIATFYSHFGAVRFKKACQKQGYEAKLMPVPRFLSSSCGTCVSYEADSYEVNSTKDELEQIVCLNDETSGQESYQVLFSAENS